MSAARQPSPATPPRLPRWLLRRALGDDHVSRSILLDLQTEFELRARARDPSGGAPGRGNPAGYDSSPRADQVRAARSWYWRQAVGVALYVLRDRLLGRTWSPRPCGPPDGAQHVRFPTSPRATSMDTLLLDLRWSIRALVATPVTTAIATLTLALGIGANTAIFTVVDGVLLRPLPYADSERLVSVYERHASGRVTAFAVPSIIQWRERQTSFEALATTSPQTTINLSGDGAPVHVTVKEVSANLFATLGVDAALGRTFAAGEDRRGAEPVAVITHGFWQRRFVGDPAAVGQQLRLNGTDHTVVGVLPASFSFTFPRSQGQDLFVPRIFTERQETDYGYHRENIIGRLAAGMTPEQARAEGVAIQAQRLQEVPEATELMVPQGVEVLPLHEKLVGDVGSTLWLLLGAVGIVLLVASANVANLWLARNSARRGELAVRVALGAGRGRLVRQAATESSLLALCGGLLGVALAVALANGFLAVAPAGIPRIEEIVLERRAVLFAFGLSLALGTLLGALPGLHATRRVAGGPLAGGSRSSGGDGAHHRVLAALVAGECALVLVLMIAAGLVLSSFTKLRAVDPGFDTSGRISVHLTLSSTRYPDAESIAGFFDEMLEGIRGLPGVRGAGGVWSQALAGSRRIRLTPPVGENSDTDRDTIPEIEFNGVTPGYFEASGIPLVEGRAFAEQDQFADHDVSIVNEAFAAFYWPGEEATGRRYTHDSGQTWITILGVVGDTRSAGLRNASVPAEYWPQRRVTFAWPTMDVVIDTELGAPTSLMPAVREAIWAVDAEQPIGGIRAFDRLVGESLASDRFALMIFAGFALLALTLGVIGIYGVVGYVVGERVREIGIRMALGARATTVVRSVVGRGLVPVIVGIVVGAVAAALLTRLMAGLLYQVDPLDATTFAAVAVLLLAVAGVATLVPARRAAAVEPVEAIRAD